MNQTSKTAHEEDVQSSALRRAGLSIGDPRAQDNLIERVPVGMEPDGILNRYEFRDERVRCSVCPRKQHHNIGITLSLPNGTKALCGSTCAVTLYGPDVWNKLELNFRAREREAILKSVAEPMDAIITRSRILATPWFSPAKAVRGFLNDFQNTAPAFLQSLKDVVLRHEGRLEGKNGAVIWTVRGGACLLSDAFAELGKVGERLRAAATLLHKSAEEVENLKQLSRLKGEIRSGLYDAALLLIAERRFLAIENMRAIARWANLSAKYGRHTIGTTSRGWIYTVEVGRDYFGKPIIRDIAIPQWPSGLEIPDQRTIDRDVFS